jgi:HCOMODA/2-hydroxy-3-carboxy-muconic semialdehyde decarboxylase
VPNALDDARYELALANRIIAHEGVLDGFGHVSVRHPNDPKRYLLARSRSPELIEPSDILEFRLDSEPVTPPKGEMYGERVIHGCIYQARPDVNAVCHHHSPSVLPFCVTGMPLEPVFHMGAVMGQVVPMWDSRDDFGDTDLMVVKPEEGRSLAKALGPHWMVLMRRHGATLAGTTLRELVFRTIYSHANAEIQLRSLILGDVYSMTPGERKRAEPRQLQARPMSRAWEYWTMRLQKADALPPQAKSQPNKSPSARSQASKPPAVKPKSSGKPSKKRAAGGRRSR